ncbi:AAA domain-containing protein [Pectobacterium sp. 13-115]|nr:AAA domain-containing protein [Pectobacterium jejuense]MCY9847229.1 AAA domain-containing protein [Pectobacterium jejuense]
MNSDSQKETLFKHLSDNLPSQLCKALTTQHRMLPQIGDLVAECFYPNKLFSVDREPAPHLKNIFPNPVVWYSTSRATEHESKKIGKTYYNDTEVKYIVKLLERINFYVQKGKFKNQTSSVAILTGYSEQRERLQTAVETKRHNWNSFSEVFINVVDAFQGREADIVIFSVTRSEEKTLGFLSEMERINVALSRGKELLIIVGDHLYCQKIGGQKNPLRDVLGYITSNSSSCTLEEIQ